MGNAEVSSDIQAAISYFGISDVSKWDTDTEALRGLTATGKTPTELLLGDNYTEGKAAGAIRMCVEDGGSGVYRGRVARARAPLGHS